MATVRLYWDTSVWIAWNDNDFGTRVLCTELLRRAEAGEFVIVLSTLALAEFAPQNDAGEECLDGYFRRSHFRVVALDRRIATEARRLVKRYPGLRGADAVHLATALSAQAQYLFTYDRRLLGLEVPGITICEPFFVGQQKFSFAMEVDLP
jgi:predicted nucleic acid-binding protein